MKFAFLFLTSSLAQELSERLTAKEQEMQTMSSVLQDKISLKDKELEGLREIARASEMTIRGLEEEVSSLNADMIC